MRMVGGTLIASTDRTFTWTAAPVAVAPPVYRFVPGCRFTPLRPGSIVKLIDDGATPLVACARSAEPVSGTLKVSLPLPILLIFSGMLATPRVQSSLARETVVVSGAMMVDV